PTRDPDPARGLRRWPAFAPGRRDLRRHDARGCRAARGRALERSADPGKHAGLDGRGEGKPATRALRPAARRARPGAGRRDAARRRARARVGPRRLRPGPEPSERRARPADLAARAPPGSPAREEPHRGAAALPLPDARAGGDARALQGHRRRARCALDRLRGLVRHPPLPPLSAAAALAEASRRGRLDGLALLPPRHRRARNARPPAEAGRWLTTWPGPTLSSRAPTWPASAKSSRP